MITGIKQKILLVDDDEEDFMIIRDMFADFPKKSFELEWVSSFQEAQKIISTNSHAAYLIDYRLGAKTGLELISDSSKAGPVILLTGQGDHEVDVEAMERGAHDYLVKSQLSPHLLERSIRYAIKRAQIMKELQASEDRLRGLYDDRLQMETQILLQDRLASIGLLASSLAHEIGTPLGVMRGRAEMTLMNPNDTGAVKKNTEIILTQIDRISKLIRSLLNLARGDESKSVKAVDVAEVLADIFDLLGPEFSKAKVQAHSQVAPQTFVLAETGPLHQVFLNLLVNAVHAVQAAEKNGKKATHKINISQSEEQGIWSIAISDTGCGIPENNMKMLFKPFFTTKAIGQGTGLGLATSYRLVEAWGGKIIVKSREGEGSTFTVQLRRANNEEPVRIQ